MNSLKKVKQLVLAAFFVAVEVVLMLTPIGFIPIGPIRATTLHIPVILAGVLLGRKQGAWMGFCFGLLSLLNNTFNPTITSFVFSPFITVGGVSGNFASLILVFAPRIFLGYFSGVVYEKLHQKSLQQDLSIAISSALNTILHTLFVMGGIYWLFGPQFANAKGMTMSALSAFISGVIATNGVMEMLLAALIVPILVRVLKPAVERMGIYG